MASRTRPPSAPGSAAPAPAGVVVLAAKLDPPRLEGRRVARPRLLERLERLSALPLTIVSAPPGFGKTTLLRQWRQARPPGATAWLSLDADDDDPDRLWAYVCAALGAAAPPPRDPAGPPAAAGELVAHALSGARARGGARVLVVDDYHHVTDPVCHERVRSLVEHLPPTLRLVIATRRDPPLPLSRLRAGGALGELRARDLRMEPEEARLLIEEPGVSLRARDVRRLHEKTEGWPAGLYLAALSLRGRDDAGAPVEAFSGSHRHVVDYMASEILAGEDERTRDFLLRTSLLDRMSGPLCDAVLGTSGSAATLRALEGRNLLVTALDDERRWFQYHPLLCDVLRFMLAEALPAEVDGLHRRAAAWWEAHGDAARAGEHALAARDARRATRIVGAHWRETAGARGAAPAIDGWLERLPRAVVLADPALCLTRAVLEEARGAPREVVEGWLEAADRDPGGGTGAVPPPARTDSVLLEAVRVRAAAGGHDVARRLGDATRAHRLAASGGPVVRALAETHLAYARWQAGRHADALAAARAALARDGARTMPLVRGVQHAVASLAMAALGDHAGADEEARAAFGRMRSHGHDRAPRATIVWLAHGTAAARRGAADEAVDALRTAVELAEGPDLALDRAHALLALARALKARGEVAGVAAAVHEARRIAGAAADPGPLRGLIAVAEPPAGAAAGITAAEMRILRLLPGPLTLREVGDRLYLSHNTVKSHTRVLYRKLEAGSREEAVARAIEAGLIPRRSARGAPADPVPCSTAC